MDTLTTTITDQFKEKVSQAVNKSTSKRKDVLFAVKFDENQQDEVAEAHSDIVSSQLPRNSKNIPASVLVMEDGRIDVNVPICLTKSQRNKVIDMNTKDKGKLKILARLRKMIEEKNKV